LDAGLRGGETEAQIVFSAWEETHSKRDRQRRLCSNIWNQPITNYSTKWPSVAGM